MPTIDGEIGHYLVKRRVIRKDHTFEDVKCTHQGTLQAGSTKRLLKKRILRRANVAILADHVKV